MQKNIKSTLI